MHHGALSESLGHGYGTHQNKTYIAAQEAYQEFPEVFVKEIKDIQDLLEKRGMQH